MLATTVNYIIGLINSDNKVMFKFRNSNVDFKDNFVNNLKTRMSANFGIPSRNFLRFKIIRRPSRERN